MGIREIIPQLLAAPFANHKITPFSIWETYAPHRPPAARTRRRHVLALGQPKTRRSTHATAETPERPPTSNLRTIPPNCRRCPIPLPDSWFDDYVDENYGKQPKIYRQPTKLYRTRRGIHTFSISCSDKARLMTAEGILFCRPLLHPRFGSSRALLL